eukprot:425980_1
MFNNSYFKSNNVITQIAISNNKFHDEDITQLLQMLTTEFSSLVELHIGGNNKISGKLPDINDSNMLIFTAENIDLYGSIPSFYLKTLKQFIVYGNRLSCTLPYNTISYLNNSIWNATKFKFIIFPQNLLSISSQGLSNQIKQIEPFQSANCLYIEYFEHINSIVIGVIALLFLFVFVVIYTVRLIYKKKNTIQSTQINLQLVINDSYLNVDLISNSDQVLRNLNDLQEPFMSIPLFVSIIALL